MIHEPLNSLTLPLEFKKLRCLDIRFDKDCDFVTADRIWSFVFRLPALVELGIDGLYEPYHHSLRKVGDLSKVRTLRLAGEHLPFRNISGVLEKFPNLEVFHFNPLVDSHFHDYNLEYFRLPNALKEFYFGPEAAPTDQKQTVRQWDTKAKKLWRRLFTNWSEASKLVFN